MKKNSSVKTVDRLVRILDCFSEGQEAWSLAELSVRLDLPKATLHRFLTSLEFHGILRRKPEDKQWYLGHRLFTWGNLVDESAALRDIAKPIMHNLVAGTGETAILTIYRNQEVICVDKLETSHSIRMALDVGRRRSPHAGASSKILMAYLPEEEIESIIWEKGLPKLCTNTITDPVELVNELARIRESGYAESHEETDPGAWGVATAIHDRNGNVMAAIGVAGPRSRYTEELAQHYVKLCDQAAQRISKQMGAE
jgi:DNA-binding IclR family transcriptional regulator